MKEYSEHTTVGWGVLTDGGVELWDANPTFPEPVSRYSLAKLLFYPKKFVLYRAIRRHLRRLQKKYARIDGGEVYIPTIVDVGCGTGSTLVDFKHLFGRSVDVYGFDVVALQIELAKEKMKQCGVYARAELYDGYTLPFEDGAVDVVYSSDVLGHVEDVPRWLDECIRVLKPGGLFALFTESSLGKHAYIRQYLLKKGINTDPHAAFHISLFSKDTIVELLESRRCTIASIRSTVLAKFLVHPEELYPALQVAKGVPVLRALNALLTMLKRISRPASLAVCELYALIELYLLGPFVESQGYIIVAYKDPEQFPVISEDILHKSSSSV